MEKQIEKAPAQCQVDVALDIFVGKWKPHILFILLTNGTMRFSELQKSIPNITQRMLTLQLRELEEQEIVKRVVYPQVPPKVEYSITDYGRTLEPILSAMHNWGSAHSERMNENSKAKRKAK